MYELSLHSIAAIAEKFWLAKQTDSPWAEQYKCGYVTNF
jgi:hypothetical protein